ncbi:hypothetical protein QBC37DRAFT_396565 [Rhypophila decipiens]|uniref:NACHT domain-containing protein n=1 Tax=Rhypophila decipiens TaxID=261697 RepID=A0AAN6YFV1_9PEZI|nr:hypothetical protein QBC37DRAFT_396565 [Rhypophila decipiens]
MDPVSAFGLASGVAQFVAFTSKLISTTVEISESASGATADTLALDTLYGKLSELSKSLSTGSGVSGAGQPAGLAQIYAGVSELSATCKNECDKLLTIVQHLKCNVPGPKRWQSFRAALRKLMAQSEIDRLEARLSSTQATLTLHICSISSYWQQVHVQELRLLQTESWRLQLDHSDTLRKIENALGSLEADNFRAQSQATVPGIRSLEQQLSQLTLSEEQAAAEQAILRSLSFDSRPTRHLTIPEAHQKTFQWVLKHGSDEGMSRLAGWLVAGKGIFWVSGKPGSGKSTLMKFVADSPETASLASKWSLWNRLIIGLLQTLLYEIFRQRPDLIEPTCSARWQQVAGGKSGKMDAWTLAELHEALRKITPKNLTSTSTEHMQVKFCFFIDGLDEYEGDHLRLCQSLQELAKSPSVKLCVSSRPWNVFEEAFGSNVDSKIYMQDLTRDNIRRYALSRLEEHPRWSLVAPIASRGKWLVDQITERACGVFLWVFIVTKLLREGLTNRDSFTDISRRLVSFPVELEPFFRQILESVEPFYHKKMASTLLVALGADWPLNGLIYEFHEQEYDNADYMLHTPTSVMNDDEMKEILENLVWRLNSRSRGLLELESESGTVTFLHRTVRDFLKTHDMSKFLSEKVARGFNTNFTLLKAHITLIKRGQFEDETVRQSLGKYNPSHLVDLTAHTLRFAGELDLSPPPGCGYQDCLDELDKTIITKESLGHLAMNLQGLPSGCFFREHLVQSQVANYLHSKLTESPTYLADLGPIVLPYLMSPKIDNGVLDMNAWRGTEMIRHVLETQTLDPNQHTNTPGGTPWQILVNNIRIWKIGSDRTADSRLGSLFENDIFSMFIEKGADPNAVLVINTGLAELSVAMAWIVFLQLAFRMPANPVNEAIYLRVLSELLDAGAGLSPLPVCVQQYVDRGMDFAPAHDKFFGRIVRMSPGQLRNSNPLLLAKIARRLLQAVHSSPEVLQSQWPRESIKAALAKFPVELVSGIEWPTPSNTSDMLTPTNNPT